MNDELTQELADMVDQLCALLSDVGRKRKLYTANERAVHVSNAHKLLRKYKAQTDFGPFSLDHPAMTSADWPICRGCGANLTRESHTSNCENNGN